MAPSLRADEYPARRRSHERKPEKESDMTLPRIASREEWSEERKQLLEKEKALTRERDALNSERRDLPMVKIEKDYVFRGPEGELSLLDMFEGRSQLIIGHFMFNPDWEDGCPSCSAGAAELSEGLLEHLRTRDTSFAYVSRAPIEKIQRYQRKRGWDFAWYSSYGSDFNYDFKVTIDESVAPAEYNYKTKEEHERAGTGYYFDAEQPIEQPGTSCFLRVGDDVFHTYSTFGRGAEMLGGSYYWLDLTALGRQENWEEPKGRAESTRSATPDFAS
jgi:predicted dithiol-disulfide oxidoreductase (DUF899 family)